MRMLGSLPVRLLDDRYRDEALAILDADPVANVFVGSRVHAAGLDPRRLGAQVWGYVRDGRLAALCYSGANLIPVAAAPRRGPGVRRAGLAQGRLLLVHRRPDRRGHRPVGDPRALLGAAPRGARGAAGDGHLDGPAGAARPGVRRVAMDQFEIVYPACVAMFTEEVGVSPNAGDGGVLYRARVAELIREGRAFARIDDGRVVFKAEVGAVTPRACQVQGVWVPPDLRGRGLSAPGMAAVVDEALRSIAPTVSLYVNDYNARARATYHRVGLIEISRFMSVLF